MTTRTRAAVVVAAVVCGIGAAAGAGWGVSEGQVTGVSTGVIRGTVTIDDIPEAVMVEVTADQATCGDEVEDRSEVVDASGGVANAVIIVTGVPWAVDPPASVVNNKDCYFQPRVQVAKTGGLVSIQSADEVLHTTHAYDDRERTMFNIAIPVPGMVIERPLRRPGVWRIECDSHRWMRGWIYVTNDMAAVTWPDGRFEISGVPAGTYELMIWHERYRGTAEAVTVTVTAGQTSEADFKLSSRPPDG